jgi:hypothetical protein
MRAVTRLVHQQIAWLNWCMAQLHWLLQQLCRLGTYGAGRMQIRDILVCH